MQERHFHHDLQPGQQRDSRPRLAATQREPGDCQVLYLKIIKYVAFKFPFLFRIRLERSVPDRIQSHANCPASLNVFFFFFFKFLKIFMDQRRLFICLTFWGLIVSRFYFCWFYVEGWSYFKQTVFSGSDMLVTLTIRTLVRKLTIQKDSFVKLYCFISSDLFSSIISYTNLGLAPLFRIF